MSSLCLLQGTFPTQEWNWGLPHCRWIFYQLSQGAGGSVPNTKEEEAAGLSGLWTCAQACPCSLLQGRGSRLNSLLSWGKSGDFVYSQDHSPEHSASSTGADRRGISGQIREGPARQRPAGRGVVPVQRPGRWPGKVPGQLVLTIFNPFAANGTSHNLTSQIYQYQTGHANKNSQNLVKRNIFLVQKVSDNH